MLTLLAGGAGLAITKQTDIKHLSRQAETVRTAQVREIAQAELMVTQVSLQLRHGMLARSADERQAAIDDILKKRELIQKTLDDYRSRLFTEKGRKEFENIPDRLKTFWIKGEANLTLVQQGRREEAFAFLVAETIPARNALLNELKRNVAYQDSALRSDIERIGAAADATLYGLLAALGLLAAGLIGSSLHLARSLQRRVEQSTQVAISVRDGDLSTAVIDARRDEFTPLLQALSEMQQSLRSIVAGVRDSAQSVTQASVEIASGNQDLSSRTEQQASALQQTAATMDELSSTVRTNAAHAQEATQLARDAVQVATSGGTLMDDVVQTMQGISESSRKIGDIIGVIDSIAFQTNILALNAAVEAARAGEQGRGFAVVATEVRNLAQRSAEAAREIKALISTSVGRVEQGSGLVSRAGATMSDIVQAIDRVSGIITDISEASQDQRSAIEQVGQAITHMDQNTQQNAAMVEQSAAAAQQMREQAEGLLQSVSSFRLDSRPA
ncbi:methyl-accepting chemotaxis protein [Sphaerotilus uruguayifluvii]|uniref:Methyl-accepting chemotaxis protein n=1 Tax=Sphaerotilus uruguayifluvii TaxID=2735897 RepID=A0ABX2G484_9BURK|nr:methyl-accepting chemotaxis protein [Leptothrix sp. C29]NRT56195.1 methyl-accepting chemotaxis protein [Leptothrix sp. C29]